MKSLKQTIAESLHVNEAFDKSQYKLAEQIKSMSAEKLCDWIRDIFDMDAEYAAKDLSRIFTTKVLPSDAGKVLDYLGTIVDEGDSDKVMKDKLIKAFA